MQQAVWQIVFIQTRVNLFPQEVQKVSFAYQLKLKTKAFLFLPGTASTNMKYCKCPAAY